VSTGPEGGAADAAAAAAVSHVSCMYKRRGGGFTSALAPSAWLPRSTNDPSPRGDEWNEVRPTKQSGNTNKTETRRERRLYVL